jgi:hypothetical protein
MATALNTWEHTTTDAGASWCVHADNGWIRYTPEETSTLEAAWNDRTATSSCQLSVDEHTYQVRFDRTAGMHFQDDITLKTHRCAVVRIPPISHGGVVGDAVVGVRSWIGTGRPVTVTLTDNTRVQLKPPAALLHGATTPAAVQRGLCNGHGATETDFWDRAVGGMKKQQIPMASRGPYKNHNYDRICSVPRCTTNARTRDLCVKHGGGTKCVCAHPGCATTAVRRRLCVKHGGRGLCRSVGCTTNAQSGAAGLCSKHGGGSKPRQREVSP